MDTFLFDAFPFDALHGPSMPTDALLPFGIDANRREQQIEVSRRNPSGPRTSKPWPSRAIEAQIIL